MSEAHVCPECGGVLVRDGSTGEVACSACGVVLGGIEYVPDRVPKTVNRGSFAFAGLPETGRPTRFELLKYSDHRYLHMLRKSERWDRVATKVAVYISNLAGKIGATKVIEEEAMCRAKRLMKAARSKGRRLTADEVAAVSLWCACRVHGFPVTAEEYESICAAALPSWKGSLLKLLNKAHGVEPLPLKTFSFGDYVKRFAAKLRSTFSDSRYIDAVTAYALALCGAVENAEELAGKSPACIAATAIRLADKRMGGRIGADKISKVLGVGFNQTALELMKKVRPPKHLWVIALQGLKKTVMEVKAYEIVRNAAR